MKNNEATVFVFIASIILGLLIAMNIGFEGKNTVLDVKQYDVAYNERTKLYSELSNLKEEYYKTYSKLEKYDSSDEKKAEITKVIQDEVSNNNIFLGKTDVEGPGIEIILDDADNYVNSDQLIHDNDVIQVINDLKNAGAEAISVNGERIIYDNYGFCGGPYINLHGVKIVSPFYINAIGNKDVLYNYLTLDQTYMTLLKTRNVKVNILKTDNVKIAAYTGYFKYNYMNPTKK
ncbi:DUF881 domain-containing protein [Clostridium sp. CM028]|uniref:DUF881 domain-containing protein n=1 Tax=unclassified Clostridium TaxID=2614128 RepID=UPI001C0B89DE|nr:MULTISPECIES: DUF881 domain-containing protein [unclassified Clostridium]MBU3091519.1 DUF881 domain-containing protein [Clostridium sp. CF011]MBW9147473.1 DUF881 domain-containing protein [Clostridium sp. CM028]WAG70140.1 DUF881 domain-containing protein [Clostridium sp. CF011]WLC61812.1 DUF881 domain-containing protein [Clostridium sp. CM028]